MIKIRRLFGLTIITGTPYEMEQVQAISGAELKDGDGIGKIPAFHHVHRNPIRKPIIKHIEDQNRKER